MNFSPILGFEILTDDKKLAKCKSLKKMVSQTFVNFKI